jgi:TIR domain
VGHIEKTVFISYRRTDIPWALAIFENLTKHGYDVFFDFSGLASGDFERVILENIRARAHFLVVLTPTALERCDDPKDWMRREIEAAIDNKRNIVPLMLAGFDFGTPAIAGQLTGKLAVLARYNALEIPPPFFREAMDRLRDRYLNVPVDAVLHPLSLSAQQTATEQQHQALAALDLSDSPPELGRPTLRVHRLPAAGRLWQELRKRGLPITIGVVGVAAVVALGWGWVQQSSRPASYNKIACTGEYERNCPGSHDLFYECDYYGSDDQIASQVCKGAPSKAVRLKTVSGNRCGYSLIEIACN